MFKILKTFYGFESRKKFWFVIFLLVLVLAAVLGSIIPYFYKLMVEAIPEQNFQKFLWILLWFLGLRTASLLFSSLSYVIGDVVTVPAAINARMAVVKHIQDLDFAFHSSKSTGSLISAIRRGDNAFYSLHFAIHERILGIVVECLVMIYFFARIDLRIVGLVVVSFVINLIFTKFIIQHNIKTRDTFNKEEDKISGVIVDNIINYETVKLFAKEDWELNRLKEIFKGWRKAFWSYANSFRILDMSIGNLVNLSIFLILLIALNLVKKTNLGLGDFVLVMGFVNSFFPRFFDLVFGFRDIAKNYSDIKTYFEILDYKVAVKDPDPKDEVKLTQVDGEINFDHVSFSYKEGKARAIKDINLRIRQGQSVALVGRSGVGKTTLVRLLMRFFDIDEGVITIDGVDIKKFTKARLRSFMGVVPQEPILFNNTIGYNIAYGKEDASPEEIKGAARIANIDEFIEGLPEKYETQVGERGIKLSGGQKQRLAIARMILSDPDIIIFDEATSHLDSESEKLIQEAFWKASENKTTIIIAHRLSTIMKADKIVVMKKGKIAEVGSHQELVRKKDGLYRHFWNLQVRK